MVDLPAPDSPTSATEEPLGTLNETLSRAVVRLSYEKLTFSVHFGRVYNQYSLLTL